MPEPIIDVLMPVYNSENTLRDSLDSILSQTINNIRIIIVDDGSTDATPSILNVMAANDKRIEIITKDNAGIVDALNLGLRHCRADLIARSDADDISFPTRLEIQADHMQRHPGCIALSGPVVHINERGDCLSGIPLPGAPELADATSVPAREPYLIHPFLMVRKSAIQAAGGYRHAIHSEDCDLYWRLQEQGELHNLDKPLGKYRIHSSSISGSSITSSRIMAVSSQLAAVSALRRKTGKADIEFRSEDRERYEAAQTFARIYQIARRSLDDKEAAHLRIASAARFLEMSNYRAYEPEYSDCTYIRSLLFQVDALPSKARASFYWLLTVVAARLLRKGYIRRAAALAPPKSYPAALYRIFGKTVGWNP